MKLAWMGGERSRSGDSGGLVTSIGVGLGATTVSSGGKDPGRSLFSAPSVAVLPMGASADPDFAPSGRARLRRG